MSQSKIDIKGSSFTLSVIHLHSVEPEIIRAELLKKMKQVPCFLKNAPVVINVEMLDKDANWKELEQAVETVGLRVVGISGCKIERQKQEIIRAGLQVLHEGQKKKTSSQPVAEKNHVTKACIINTPVRSGQQIYARNSDLVVVSSVSAGAELIADGNIHIYGMMRGRALAGASGDTDCRIFCMYLSAELLSIAGQYLLSDQIPSRYLGQSIQLSLLDHALTIKNLN